MKKSTLFMACCIGLMLFASCKKHVAPTVTLMQGEGYLTENAQVYANQSYKIGFIATGEKLTHLETTLTQNGVFVCSYPESINELDTYNTSYPISIDVTGAVTITCVVTDKEGMTATKSFNVICNEKPNAKFVGRYEGNALATGSMDVEMNGMDPMNQEFTDREVPVVLELEAGSTMNEVVGTCIFEDRTIDCKGTVDGNVVTFEAVNDVITFNYDLGGFTVSPQLNVTYTIKGTLTDGQLLLDGTCSGEGDINMFLYHGTITMNATVGGSLTKN